MRKRRVIHWFRNNLRLHDNASLYRALKNADEVISVYIIDSCYCENTVIDAPRMGPFRRKFLIESLLDLQRRLQIAGGQLWVFEGKADEIIPELALKYDAEAVYCQAELDPAELSVEEKLEARLWKYRIRFECCWQSTLFHLEDLPFPLSNLPKVFTDFRKETENHVRVRDVYPTPEHVPFPFGLSGNELPLIALKGQEPQGNNFYAGGESNGLKRLQYYLWESDLLKNYKETRNGLLGWDYSSKFSPWLALGCLSPRRIFYEIKNYEEGRVKNESTYWMIFELLWRDYFKFVHKKHGAQLFVQEGIQNKNRKYSEDLNLFKLWARGHTGVPFIDANMRELNTTGFMSNRGRQNVASFLVKDLEINWTWGAIYFESMLIDYDASSNWGNWNYIAGTGNDPRKDRYFNILSQGKRYDGQGDYVRHWLPELSAIPGGKIHEPWKMCSRELSGMGVVLGENYPHAGIVIQ
ncbi:MAG: DASH family cryptochrome [Cyclobacteriaceae bacterium]|nr:DASH family cryptochrome [Cyclobacteriaceae bacterium]